MEELYRMIRRAGFDGVMLWWNNEFRGNVYRNAPLLARKAGLYIENLHTPFEDVNNLWLDTLDGDAIAECFLRCVADCAEFEIPTMVVHLSDGDHPPPYNTRGLNRIKRIVEKAEKSNVNVAFENLRRTDYLAFVLEQVDSPRAGFCYDIGHHNCRTPNDDVLSAFGSRLMALHLHDNDGRIIGAGEEDQHRLPFDGTIDWPATMRKISENAYSGAVALEVINWGYENLSAEAFLHMAFERAKQLETLKAS